MGKGWKTLNTNVFNTEVGHGMKKRAYDGY